MDILTKEGFNEEDIRLLIKNQAEESVFLEFKAADALKHSTESKKEIAKDVSSFANSEGGVIVYGILEEDHVAKELSYIDGAKFTKESLEQIISDGIQRRISGIRIFPVRFEGDIKKSVYVVQIPQSDDSPHATNDGRFYKRSNFKASRMEE